MAFLESLISEGPAPDISDKNNIFGFLIGSWDLKVRQIAADDTVKEMDGEVHASWVLEGRAIQDLFIFPRRIRGMFQRREEGDRYATTIRMFDKRIDAWQVDFINPAAIETSAQLIARRSRSGIEMEGFLLNGTPIRWWYRSITSESFQYFAERAQGQGGPWQIYLELSGTRAKAA